jgi:endonuclease YncB( thermonuclease family)
MQPNRRGSLPSWPRGHWRGRSRMSCVRLALVLTFAAAMILFGRHHGGRWRSAEQTDPFPPSIAGTADPIDGDSLWLGGDEVRLKGIDAPEWKQGCELLDGQPWDCGQVARAELVRAIGSDEVACSISKRDVYGRMLGFCRAGGRDLNAAMVSTGMAVAYGGSYWNEQADARSAKRGLWSGKFTNPRDWRAKHASEEGR